MLMVQVMSGVSIMDKLISEVKEGLVLLFPTPVKQEPECGLDYDQLLAVAKLLREQSVNAVKAIECGIAHDEEFLIRMRRVNDKSGLLLGVTEQT